MKATGTPAPLVVEYRSIEEWRPYAFNLRRISEAELEALTRGIQQFGVGVGRLEISKLFFLAQERANLTRVAAK